MRGLFTGTELRRYDFVNLLGSQGEWLTLSALSEALGVSDRVLREDVVFLRENFNQFAIETSKKGVQLTFKQTQGILSVARQIIKDSKVMQLIETVFFNQNLSVAELADETFQSTSTVYRLIKQINDVFKKYGFEIETNPCRVVGEEKAIRRFYYAYFKEAYAYSDYPFHNINEDALNGLIQLIVGSINFDTNFSFLNELKWGASVGITRYLDGNLVQAPETNNNMLALFFSFSDLFTPFEKQLGFKLDQNFFEQAFFASINMSFSLNYDDLMEKSETHEDLAASIDYLNNMLDKICEKFELTLNNRKKVILNYINAVDIFASNRHNTSILYDEYSLFKKRIETSYPNFTPYVINLIKNHLTFIHIEKTEHTLEYLFHILITAWDDLLFQLSTKVNAMRVLIISESNVSFAQLLQTFFTHATSDLITYDVYDGNGPIDDSYDLYITDYPVDENFPNCFYIENLPTLKDANKLYNKIAELHLSS